MENFVEKWKDEGRREGERKGRKAMRAAVRRVLAVRNLTPSAEDEARLNACKDIATLGRWHEQAITEALRGNRAPDGRMDSRRKSESPS